MGDLSVVKIYIIRPKPGPVVADNVGVSSVYYTLMSSVVEHWSSNPEDADSIHYGLDT